MIANFTEAEGLTLANQSKVLNQKPKTVVLGGKKFSAIAMTFNNKLQVTFLTTVVKNTTYMFTLVTEIPNAMDRNNSMKNLLNIVTTMK